MNILTSRYRQAELHAAAQRSIHRALLDSIDHTPTTVQRATLPGDKRRLRGIPVAGGACGTSPGTDPALATIRRLRHNPA